MKKYFLSIVAMAAMLFATSCQESIVEPQVGGPTTFTIEIPGQMGTKAVNDPYKLFVEVYSADGSASYHRIEAQDMAVGTATTVTLNLVANQEYDIIFWAQKNADSYGVRDLSTVQMNANHHNSETGAAFYAVLNNYNPTQGKKDVKLTRPFAQLNLYTTNDVAYGKVNLVKSTITIEGVADKFNRVNQNGETFGEGVDKTTYTYTSNILPTGTKEIGGVVYQYVSMDYLAVPGNQNLVKVTAVIDVRDEKGNTSQITRVIDQVPVQMNYRTNIIGNLITSASDFEVSIDETWGDPDETVEFREVSTADELIAAVNAGVEEIVLVADIELDQPLMFGAPASSPIARASATEVPSSYVLDLNGKTISGEVARGEGVIKNYADLTISGGTIISTKENGGAAIYNEGNLTIENMTIYGAPSNTATGYASYAVNTEGTASSLVVNNSEISGRGAIGATDGTKVEVNGGTYHTPAVAWGHAIYADGEGTEVIINDGTFSEGYEYAADLWGMYQIYSGNKAKVIVNGGDFSQKWDCANGYDLCTATDGTIEIYGGVFADNPASQNGKNFVADGYKAVKAADEETYVVLPDTDNYDIVITNPTKLDEQVLTTYKNILLQLSAGEHIIDLYMTRKPSLSYDANLTIIGTKGTKVAFAEGQVMMELVKNFTIKNCEILHMATKSWGMLVFGSGNKAEGVYTIENCTFNGVGTQGIYINEGINGATYNIIKSTFNGDFGGEGAITIQTNKDVEHIVNVERCEFNNIPATSHRIFLAPYDGKKGLFYGFELNTDLKATTAYELEMFLALGEAQLGCNLTFSAKETSANSGYGATGVKVAGGSVLDGQGHTLTVNDAWGTWDCVVAAKGGRIENLTVSGAMRGIFMPGADGDVYINNVIFDNVIYTFNSDAGNTNYGVYISNSTLNGWTSHSDVHKEVVYTNCKFGEGNGYAFCRPYGPTSFVGCDFVAGFEVDARGLITFENCTIGGVALTAENLSTLVTSNTANASVK